MQFTGSRREFVATAALTALAAGCTGRTDDGAGERAVADADRYDCGAVDRPEPAEPDDEHALEPRPYPAFDFDPDSTASFSAAAEAFVVEFERTYRRNALIERYGERAYRIQFYERDDGTETIETGGADDAAVVSLGYDLAYRTSEDATDAPGSRAVYYVDERLALRGPDGGGEPGGSLFEPDPRDEGTLVACFD